MTDLEYEMKEKRFWVVECQSDHMLDSGLEYKVIDDARGADHTAPLGKYAVAFCTTRDRAELVAAALEEYHERMAQGGASNG